MPNSSRVQLTLITIALLTMALALCVGPMGFDIELMSLRSSRVFLGMFCGAVLGLTGCALQSLMRNPLADPYILGVSGGAAAFGAISIALFQSSQVWATPLASFVGSVLVSFLLVAFLRQEGRTQNDRAILLGIAINGFASSFITILKTLVPARITQSLLFWLMGSIGYVEASWLLVVFVLSAPFFVVILMKARTLDLLSLGDDEATRLGVRVQHEKKIIYLCASFLIGVSVSLCGMIAFVGLITPHALKPFIGSNQRLLLPSSALLGLIIVAFADTLSRFSYALFASEVPVGALLSLIGAPVFVWILTKRGAHAPD